MTSRQLQFCLFRIAFVSGVSLEMQRSMSSPGRMIGGAGVKAATESVEAVPVQRRRVAVVMYFVVFLYAAAFWIQTGVMPVGGVPHDASCWSPLSIPCSFYQRSWGLTQWYLATWRQCLLWLLFWEAHSLEDWGISLEPGQHSCWPSCPPSSPTSLWLWPMGSQLCFSLVSLDL